MYDYNRQRPSLGINLKTNRYKDGHFYHMYSMLDNELVYIQHYEFEGWINTSTYLLLTERIQTEYAGKTLTGLLFKKNKDAKWFDFGIRDLKIAVGQDGSQQ